MSGEPGDPLPPRPGAARALLRGIAKRCPRCGRGKLFRRWFTMAERCPRCGLRLEPEEGAFLGSLAINYGVTGVVFIAMLVIWLVATLPEVRIVPMLITGLAISAIVPLLFYPFAKTIWASIDYVLHGEAGGERGEVPRGG